jgi:hypothetical protein
VRFYFDRTQSPHLARAVGEILQHMGHDFDYSRRRYPDRDPGDIIWLQELGAEGAGLFVPAEQAWRLLRWLPSIIDAAATEQAGTGLSLPLRWHAGRYRFGLAALLLLRQLAPEEGAGRHDQARLSQRARHRPDV